MLTCAGYLAHPFLKQDERSASVILQTPTTRGMLMLPFWTHGNDMGGETAKSPIFRFRLRA